MPKDMTFDDKQLKKFERDLTKLRAKAIPFATRQMINSTAKAIAGLAKKNVRDKMITRNRFTEDSIQTELERTSLRIDKQRAIAGSVQPYMEDQEFGATKVSRGKHGVPLPTHDASNEGRSGAPRRKLPTPANRLKRIKISKNRPQGKNRRHTNVLTVQAAVEGRKAKHVVLHTRRGAGIYRVKGMGKGKVKVDLILDLSHKSVTIPKRPWLGPAVDKGARMMPANYKRALREQLVRHRLFTK